MEASLLDSLHHKLRDLEHNLHTHRHDMVAQFRRHCHDTLRDVDPHVAANVHHAIALSLAAYPLLRPGLELDKPDSPPPGPAASQSSPPPAVSGNAPRAPVSLHDSLHEREKELQGLFTPSYLPLLETSPVLPSSPTAVAVADAAVDTSASGLAQPPMPASPGSGAASSAVEMDGDNDAGGAEGSSSSALQLPGRPHHARTPTEDTNSTGTSDRSETKPARSALRRSSSAAKPPQSPRRVRFEFMGAEVLPTSSPKASDLGTPGLLSPSDQSEAVASDSILGVPPEEEEKERLPPPRKISSSEALRALSRTPLEEGTVWTVVNPDADDSAFSNRGSPSAELASSPEGSPAPTPIAQRPATPVKMPEPTQRSPLRSVHEEPEADGDDSSSDEEFLAMGKSKSFASKKAISPTKSISPKREPEKSPKAVASTANKEQPARVVEAEVENDDDEDDDEDDELFHFESGGLTAPPKPRPRPPPLKEETKEEAAEDDVSASSAAAQQPLYATSPAVTIAPRPQVSSGPPTPTTAKFQAGSLGSYKGRSVVMPVVRDPDVLAQAESLGQFNTFVGGLDGRSGMDEGDLNSFRASVPQPGFSGTPRSFSERFMMEEANRERGERGDKDDTSK